MKSKIELYTSDKVKQYRLKAEMSLQYFADCLNVTPQFIHDCENPQNQQAFKFDHVNEIAKLLNLSIWELVPQYPL